MRAYELAVLRERLNREGATIGASIPEQVIIDGAEYPLRQAVIRLTGGESLTDSERLEVTELKRALRQVRRAHIDRLEDDACTFDTGADIVETVTGIDRALNALDGIGAPDVETQARHQEAVNQKRWMAFLREALGHDRTGRRR